jgi:hypothetical protein
MAITGQITLNQINMLEVDSPPTAGLAASIGTRAFDSVTGISYSKVGPLNTDWQITATNLNQLSDVDVITDPPQAGEVLLYSGSNWVNRRLNVALVSGKYYDSTLNFLPASFATAAFSTTNMRAVVFVLTEATTFDQIGIECTTSSAGSSVRVGVYTSTNAAPDALLYQTATLASTSTGFKSENIAGGLTLSAGVYWLAQQQSSNTPNFRALATTAPTGILGYDTGTDITATTYVFRANTYASGFPATFGAATDTTGTAPRIMLRKA